MKTKEELDALNEVELSDDELKKILGSCGNSVFIRKRCEVCGMEISWAGDCINGEKHVCPQILGMISGIPSSTATEPSFDEVK